MLKIRIHDAFDTEHTEYRGEPILPLDTDLKDMGDGRYYDSQGRPYAEVHLDEFDENGEYIQSQELLGYVAL